MKGNAITLAEDIAQELHAIIYNSPRRPVTGWQSWAGTIDDSAEIVVCDDGATFCRASGTLHGEWVLMPPIPGSDFYRRYREWQNRLDAAVEVVKMLEEQRDDEEAARLEADAAAVRGDA